MMPVKGRTSWDNVRVPSNMLKVVDIYLESELAKQKGFKSRSDVMAAALRDYLEKDGVYPRKPRMSHFNVYEDNVKVVDNDIRRIATVYFKSGKVFCDVCESEQCIHIDFAYGLPLVCEALAKNGYRRPKPEWSTKD